MSVSLSQFINTPPTAENIQALVSASKVIGLTVSTTDCKLNNYQSSLSQLTTITVDGLNNNEPIQINSITSKPQYYYYEVEPFSIVSSFDGDECLVTNFTPFLEAIGFDNSDFNVLFNNASSSRASAYIQDVDRDRDAIKPTNIENILNNTALRATVPDSYYTSLAHISGRYIGSKTSEEEYGVSPALGVKFFEGAEYLVSVSTGSICSIAISDRKVKTFVYTGNSDFPVSGSRVFIPEGSKALPVRNRQIWVSTNTRIIQTDEDGYISSSGSLCS